MRKITDYNEFLKIWELNHKNRYWGNKRISKEEEAIIIDKANLKDFKRYSIYMLDDGYYLVFDTKPSIESVLYYDDETPEPEKCLNYFIDYNLKLNFKYDLSNWLDEINNLKTIGCCSGNIETRPFINISFLNSSEVYALFYQSLGRSRKDNTTIRDLTDKEIDEYVEICKNLKDEYIERLTKYFNKYNKNIHNRGYWANR